MASHDLSMPLAGTAHCRCLEYRPMAMLKTKPLRGKRLAMASIPFGIYSKNLSRLIILLIAGVYWPQDAFAQGNLDGMRMTSLRGRCIRVMVAGRDLPAQCSPDPANALLLNTSYPDGRSGFYIVTDGFILTFSGMGSLQIKTSPDSVVQPVDLVLLNRLVNGDPNRPAKLRATGTCSYENPTRGVPTMIECMHRPNKGYLALSFFIMVGNQSIWGNRMPFLQVWSKSS